MEEWKSEANIIIFAGIEPATFWLQVGRSTKWAKKFDETHLMTIH